MDIPATLEMYVGEIRLYAIDFTDQQEIVNGETISTADSLTVDRDGLTLSTDASHATPIPPAVPTISGKKILMWISGLAGRYLLTGQITTSGGAKLKAQGRLIVHYVK